MLVSSWAPPSIIVYLRQSQSLISSSSTCLFFAWTVLSSGSPLCSRRLSSDSHANRPCSSSQASSSASSYMEPAQSLRSDLGLRLFAHRVPWRGRLRWCPATFLAFILKLFCGYLLGICELEAVFYCWRLLWLVTTHLAKSLESSRAYVKIITNSYFKVLRTSCCAWFTVSVFWETILPSDQRLFIYGFEW